MKLFSKILYLLEKMKIKFKISCYNYNDQLELRWGSRGSNVFAYSNKRYSFCKQGFNEDFSFDKFKNHLTIFSYIQEITKANQSSMYWAHVDRKVIDENIQ